MRNIGVLCILLVSFYGCKRVSDVVTIQGEIKGLTNDVILLYSNDERKDFVEKIVVEEGKFLHTMLVDTLTEAILVFNHQQSYPVYLDKGNKIEIKGDTSSSVLKVKGNVYNKELAAFYNTLGPVEEQVDSVIERRVEEYIRSHQKSPSSMYLLDKYFVSKDSFDLATVKRLVAYMDGTLQDRLFIENLNKFIENAEKSVEGKTAPSYTLTDSEGNRVSRTNHRNKVVLISFWASWSDSCRVNNAELRKIYKVHSKFGKDKKRELDAKFAMLGVSLDFNKQEWQAAVKADTLEWQQVCEFKGWEASIIDSYSVTTLPYNLLIGADGKIVARGLQGEELADKVKELVDKENEKEKEKERNKRKS